MADDDYKPGYKKPPKGPQYKPGQSGNPAGRPKGSLGRKTIWKQVLLQLVPVKIYGKTKNVPMFAAVITNVASQSLQGNLKASDLILKHAKDNLPDDDEPHEILPAPDVEKGRQFFRDLAERARAGETLFTLINGKKVPL